MPGGPFFMGAARRPGRSLETLGFGLDALYDGAKPQSRMTCPMSVSRTALALAAGLAGLTAAAPASAQFFLQSYRFPGGAVVGDETGIGMPLPGATPQEVRASLVWNMRAALNVAALQCQFEPTLLTVPNYNAMLKDHDGELDAAQAALTKYFARVNKAKAAGQKAWDSFNTKTYSSFSTVGSQYGFCQTAASIGRDAVFTPRGQFGSLAAERMRELRNSLFGAWGEQALSSPTTTIATTLPRLDPPCWDKKGRWVRRKCGELVWPPQPATALAAS